MHLGQGVGRAEIVGPVIIDPVARLAEIGEQPQDAGRAGILQGVERDHGRKIAFALTNSFMPKPPCSRP